MYDTSIILGANLVGKKLQEFKNLDKKELARKAFELACSEDNSWFTTSEDVLFRIGCGGLLLVFEEDDKANLEQELNSLKAISAATSGIPVDIGAALDGMNPDDMLGVLGIFKEVYASSGRA
jgi:hypothetical protein